MKLSCSQPDSLPVPVGRAGAARSRFQVGPRQARPAAASAVRVTVIIVGPSLADVEARRHRAWNTGTL
eukprot:3799272-Rhodomonas_salina.3